MYDLYMLHSYLNFYAHYILVNFWRRDVYFLNKCFIRVFYRFNGNRALQKQHRKQINGLNFTGENVNVEKSDVVFQAIIVSRLGTNVPRF